MIEKNNIIIKGRFLLIFLTAFSLLWSTKLIIRPAAINYWEISGFLSMIFLSIFCLFNFKYLLLNFRNRNFLKLTILALACLELFIIISIFFSPDYLLSLYRYFIFILAVLLFLILRVLPKAEKEVASWGFLSAVFCQSIIAIWQFIQQKSMACKYLGLAAQEAAVLGTAVIETSSGRWLRAYGALDHPNILGGITAIACLWSAWYLITNQKKAIGFKIFLWLVYLSSLTALFFSFSRAAWLAFLLAKVVLALFIFYQKINCSRMVLVVLASIFLLTPLVLSYQDLLNTRLLARGRLETASLISRQESVKNIGSDLRSQVLVGRGFGASTVWQFQQDSQAGQALAPWAYQPIHNVYLLLWLEIGLLGLLAALIFLASVTRNLIKKRSNFLAPGMSLVLFFLVIAFFDHWLISLPVGLFSWFFFLGIIE